MNRTEERIAGGLHRLADRVTPSPDAWETVRRRIADHGSIQETEIIMLTGNTTARKRSPLVAAAAAVVALGITALVVATIGGSDTDVPADSPDTTEAEAVPEPEAGPAADVPRRGAFVEPGRYQSDLLGIPIEFTLPTSTSGSRWIVGRAAPGHLAFGVHGEDTPEYFQMYRVSSWYDTDEAFDLSNLSGSLDPLDIDGWIAAHGISVEESGTTTVGGRSAEYRLLTIPENPAGDPALCIAGQTPVCLIGAGPEPIPEEASLPAHVVHGSGRQPVLWLIALDEFAPLLIEGSTTLDDPEQWREDVLGPFVESITLGEPGPAAG